MYEQFQNHFKEFEQKDANQEDISLFKQLPEQFIHLFSELGGKSYEKGLYKIHNINTSIRWSIKIENYYTSYKKKVYPFGYDWLGRQFCVSSENSSQLLMFDPATGEYFTLSQDLAGFHNDDLVHDKYEILSSTLFEKTLESLQLTSMSFDDCIGYKVPLFLGGEDVMSNLERQNIEVYWDIQFQLINQVKDLPPGTSIRSIGIER